MQVALQMGTLVKAGYGFTDCLRIAGEMGFRYVELWIDLDDVYTQYKDKQQRLEKLSMLNSYGLKAISTCPIPFTSSNWQSFDFEYNLASQSEHERAKAVKWYKLNMDLAAELGTSTMLAVPGKIDEPDFMRSKHSYRQYWSSLIRSLKECAKHAEDVGVTMGIENTVVSNFLNLACEIHSLVDEVNSDNVRAYLDIANANVFQPPEVFIEELKGRLCGCIHATDNDGTYPYHLPIGMGTIDYESVLHLLKKVGWDGYILPEIFYDKDILKNLKDTKEKLLEIIGRL
ncbi:MAG: sugar phosphate isomerase/epimerase family protein [Nitrososphaerota archaeon]